MGSGSARSSWRDDAPLLLFINDLPRWCRRHGLARTAALEETHRRIVGLLWSVYRVRGAMTRTGKRLRLSRPIELRDASPLRLDIEEIREARRRGDRILLGSRGQILSRLGELGPARLTSSLTEHDVWNQLTDVPLTEHERAVLGSGMRRLVKLANTPTLAPCRFCYFHGRQQTQWLIRKGRMQDCGACAKLPAVKRTRIVQDHSRRMVAMRQRAHRQAVREGFTGAALRDRISELMWRQATERALRDLRLTRWKRLRRSQREYARRSAPTKH